MLFTAAIQLAMTGLALAVSNPSGQKVTSSSAFSSGAGNNNNANIYDGTGNAGSDTYSKSPNAHCVQCVIVLSPYMFSNNRRVLLWRLGELPPRVWMDWIWRHVELLKECHGRILCRPRHRILLEWRWCFWSWQQRRANWLDLECYPASCPDFFSWSSIHSRYNFTRSKLSNSNHQTVIACVCILTFTKSIGCVNVCPTNNPDPSQPDNPGLMQSDGGVTFVGNSASNSAQQSSITQMVIDGTQGTALGDGLVQCINQYGNIYEVSQREWD